LGTYQPNLRLYPYNEFATANRAPAWRGKRRYELTGHTGDVLALVSDCRKAATLNGAPATVADVRSMQDYYPFGMPMPGRSYTATGEGGYRYGFQGMEKEDGMKGAGNGYTTEFREYDARVGRWLSMDALQDSFPQFSPFISFDNNSIIYMDVKGMASAILLENSGADGYGHIGAILYNSSSNHFYHFSFGMTFRGDPSSGSGRSIQSDAVFYEVLPESYTDNNGELVNIQDINSAAQYMRDRGEYDNVAILPTTSEEDRLTFQNAGQLLREVGLRERFYNVFTYNCSDFAFDLFKNTRFEYEERRLLDPRPTQRFWNFTRQISEIFAQEASDRAERTLFEQQQVINAMGRQASEEMTEGENSSRRENRIRHSRNRRQRAH
jgi:RHS repeat-associated protein